MAIDFEMGLERLYATKSSAEDAKVYLESFAVQDIIDEIQIQIDVYEERRDNEALRRGERMNEELNAEYVRSVGV